jgi:serine/threonine-protein kinase OXI1
VLPIPHRHRHKACRLGHGLAIAAVHLADGLLVVVVVVVLDRDHDLLRCLVRRRKSNSFVGTEDYVAPEIIAGRGHDFTVDWWGLGMVLYEMLYGRTPFRGQSRKETFYRVLTKQPELVGEQTPLHDLIARLLEKDPEKRIGARGVKAHPFFRGVDWDRILQVARPPFIPTSPPQDEGEDGDEALDVEKVVREVFASNDAEGGKA